MKKINIYIIEKLKIDKEVGRKLNFPIRIKFYSQCKSIYSLRDEINAFTDMKEFGLQDLKQNGANYYRLYEIEITNRNDLLWFFIHLYAMRTDKEIFAGTEVFEDDIENIDEIKNYIDNFTREEYQNRIKEYIELEK